MARAGSFVHNLTQPPHWFRPGGHDLFRVSRWGHGIFSDEICLSCFLKLQCHNVQTEWPSSYHLAQVIVSILSEDSATVVMSFLFNASMILYARSAAFYGLTFVRLLGKIGDCFLL